MTMVLFIYNEKEWKNINLVIYVFKLHTLLLGDGDDRKWKWVLKILSLV